MTFNLRTAATVALLMAPTAVLAESAPKVGESILGIEVNITKVAATGYSANALIGAPVRNDKNTEIGSVHDLIVATDGEVSLAIVEVGGFLGVGSKWVAVPADLFKPGSKNEVILAGATQAALEQMPSFRYAN